MHDKGTVALLFECFEVNKNQLFRDKLIIFLIVIAADDGDNAYIGQIPTLEEC